MPQPSRAALGALVSLVALGALFVLGLYALTPQPERRGLLTMLAPALAGVLAGVPAFLAWLSGQKLNAQHKETSEAVARVEQQTNGELTRKINEANDRLREELLEQLLPTQETALLHQLAAQSLTGKRITDRPTTPLTDVEV